MDLERDIVDFLWSSTIPCAISAFAKRSDVIVADRACKFRIVRSQCHDLKSLEDVLLSVEKERRKRRGPLTRRFIITEGIFEVISAMVDLPKLIEPKHKYKYRLLDESISFGTAGRTGRGLTEVYNVPVCTSFYSLSRVFAQLSVTQIDMIVGWVANGLNSSGGFCTGSRIVVDHQRINGTSFVF
ncbi:hypothetical protein EDB83DRAFT_2527670 [Lactarius deliciosus]|nr:hypothetical protein EDB83DRAFT_2528807 [Lactarius deliciosus]KAH9021676.1 hypothetical protein EDB83DRAFT_2527670 [Lactarius deliciosus]